MQISETDLRIPGPDGAERRYVTTKLPYDQAYMLGLRLATMIGGPMGAAMTSVLDGEAPSKDGDDMGMGHLGAALAGLPRELLKAGPALLDEVLAGTWVAGQDNDGKAMKIRLNTAKGRAHAWDGLSPESFRVIKWVLGVNFGPLLTAAWAGSAGLLTRGRDWLIASGLGEEAMEALGPLGILMSGGSESPPSSASSG